MELDDLDKEREAAAKIIQKLFRNVKGRAIAEELRQNILKISKMSKLRAPLDPADAKPSNYLESFYAVLLDTYDEKNEDGEQGIEDGDNRKVIKVRESSQESKMSQVVPAVEG